MKNSNNFYYVFFRFNHECYDTKENLGAYELYQMKKQYQENPIFSKFTLVNNQTTVQDIYAIVLRKLVRVTSIREYLPAKKPQQSWHEFYLSILQQLISK